VRVFFKIKISRSTERDMAIIAAFIIPKFKEGCEFLKESFSEELQKTGCFVGARRASPLQKHTRSYFIYSRYADTQIT